MSDPAEELYEAARDGDNAKVDALISEHGINVQDGDGGTALHKAAINTNIALGVDTRRVCISGTY